MEMDTDLSYNGITTKSVVKAGQMGRACVGVEAILIELMDLSPLTGDAVTADLQVCGVCVLLRLRFYIHRILWRLC